MNVILKIAAVTPGFALMGGIANIALEIIIQGIGKTEYFDYEFLADTGENGAESYLWDGGEQINRFWGLSVQNKVSIKDAILIEPIKYLDAQEKTQYYFNGKYYNELDLEEMKKDIVHYYHEEPEKIIPLIDPNAQLFDGWNLNQDDLEKIKADYVEKGDQKAKEFLLNNYAWIEEKNTTDEVIQIVKKDYEKALNDANFKSRFTRKVYINIVDPDTTIDFPKSTDSIDEKLAKIKPIVENLDVSYYSEIPNLVKDPTTNRWLPVDQIANNNQKLFDGTIFDEERDINSVWNAQPFSELTDPNKILFYSNKFTEPKLNTDWWEKNKDLIAEFNSKFSVLSKTVSKISYLERDKYEDMNTLTQRTIFEFNHDFKKYYFINLNYAKNYIINKVLAVKPIQIEVSQKMINFDGQNFLTIQEAIDYYISKNHWVPEGDDNE